MRHRIDSNHPEDEFSVDAGGFERDHAEMRLRSFRNARLTKNTFFTPAWKVELDRTFPPLVREPLIIVDQESAQ